MKANLLKIVAVGVFFSSVLTAPAYAIEDGYEGQSILYKKEMMNVMDTNNDKKISKKEFMAMSSKMASKKFMMMDMNDDGFLSAVEYGLGWHDS